jgi:hypothetical protein
MPKRIYDPALVRSLLAERERNMWSLGELSRRSGIPVGTLSTWSAKEQRLRREVAEPQSGFTEVVMAADATGPDDSMVRLRHDNGWAVELHGAAAITIATKLAEAISRCS